MASNQAKYRAQATFALAQEWQATLFLAQLKAKATEVTGMSMDEYLTYREMALNKLKDRKAADAKDQVRVPWDA